MARIPLIIEEANTGGQLDMFPSELNPVLDKIGVKGVQFSNNPNLEITDDGTNIKAKDLNTLVEVNLETMAWGSGRQIVFSSEYYRVPLGHNHFTYQEIEVQLNGEYEIRGELVVVD
jgi:hypothetical protein